MRRPITALAALLIASCGGRDEAGNDPAGGNKGAGAGPARETGGPARETGGPASGGGGAAASLAPGLYETRVEVTRLDMVGGPDLPPGATPPIPAPTIVRSCLTPDQAARPSADFLTGSGTQAGCTYENLSMAGGRIQGGVTCDSQGTSMRATMNGRFSAEGYAVEQESRIEANGVTVESASRVTSRRIGDCPAT